VQRPFEQTFSLLFAEHFPSLFRYLDRLCGDTDLAADLAQETFVRLFTRGSAPDDVRAWLATVGNNLFRDERKRTSRRAGLLARWPGALVPDESAAADAPGDAAEQRDVVRGVLDSLPLRDRQLLLLRHGGYSYREIAQTLGVAETSVGTLLIRATSAFRAAFEARNASL